MLVTAAALDALRTGFRNDFNIGFKGFAPMWSQVATRVPSSTHSNTYGWLKDFPRMREWLGDRQIKSLTEGSYSVANKDFEATVGVNRNAIEDDTFGIYAPMMQGLGFSAAEFPDELVFGLLANGFTQACWDGQNFFDTDHPVGDNVVSNLQAGASPAWFLMDTTRPLKPLLFQERKPPQFIALDRPDDEAVFSRKEFRYGVDARWNAGFGMWQYAFASQAALTADNYADLRKQMTSQVTDEGHKMNVKPNVIVFGPSNRATAKQLFQAERIASGADNIYYKDVDLVEVPWLE